MSRVGLKVIPIPSGVRVSADGEVLRVSNSKGELSQRFDSAVSFSISDTEVAVKRKDDSKRSKSMHGLYRSLLSNMIVGLSEGYAKVLVINGVGYRAELNGKSVMFNLGYSNVIEYLIPEGTDIEIEANNRIKISGISKELVGQIAAEIRSLRPPEPYKGKGIKYIDEVISRKVGKSGVK